MFHSCYQAICLKTAAFVYNHSLKTNCLAQWDKRDFKDSYSNIKIHNEQSELAQIMYSYGDSARLTE